MSKKAKRSKKPTPLVEWHLEAEPAPYEIQALVLRRFSFQELEKPSPISPEEMAALADGRLEVGGGYELKDGLFLDTYLDLDFRPNPHSQPVSISGRASVILKIPEKPGEETIRAMQIFGLRTAYSYLRDVIIAATARGAYGMVLLRPLALTLVRMDSKKG